MGQEPRVGPCVRLSTNTPVCRPPLSVANRAVAGGSLIQEEGLSSGVRAMEETKSGYCSGVSFFIFGAFYVNNVDLTD